MISFYSSNPGTALLDFAVHPEVAKTITKTNTVTAENNLCRFNFDSPQLLALIQNISFG